MNLVEWVLNIAAILTCLAVFCPEMFSTGTAHIIAAIAVFCAWFNYLLYLQRFNSFGIYVVMFLEILSTLLRVLSVFSVLIIAFGLSFYILMRNMVSNADFLADHSSVCMTMQFVGLEYGRERVLQRIHVHDPCLDYDAGRDRLPEYLFTTDEAARQ